MKYLWYFLHTVALSAIPMSATQASSDEKTSLDFQAVQRNLLQLTQQLPDEIKKTSAGKTSEQGNPSEVEKSLPAIVPETKAAEAKKFTSYHQRSNSYATNPESDPPRYVRRLSDIGVEAFKDVTWL